MQLGRYNLLHRIAAGGMAEVWKAKAVGASSFEKTVAIKRLLPTLNNKPDVIRMFIEEAKLAAGLTHPNIVQVFDFGQDSDDRYFIAMEYVPGCDLGSLHKAKNIPLEVALFVGIETCKALGHAHSRRIIHRDVSPRNVLVSFDGELKVADFGIAKVFTHLTEHTMPGVLKGKPPYMSPEQVRQRPLDPRSDLFSLGTVLHELLLGYRLFSGSPSTVFSQILTYEGIPRDTLSSLPSGVADVLECALEPDPDERYQTVLELEAALMEVVAGRGLVEARGALAALTRDAAKASEHHGKTPVPDPHADTGTIISKREVADIESTESPAPQADAGSWNTHTAPIPGARPKLVPLVPAGAKREPAKPKRRKWPLFAGLGTAAVLLAAAASSPWWAQNEPTPTETVTQVSPTPAADTSTATPVVVVRTRRPKTTTPTPTPVVRAAKLNITSEPAWVRVLVDGAVVAEETPATGLSLQPGPHHFVFENPHWKFRAERNLEIKAGQQITLHVDLKSGVVSVQ